MVKSTSKNKFLVRFKKFLLYAGSSVTCFYATARLLVVLGSGYGSQYTFDNSWLVLLFVVYSVSHSSEVHLG